MIILRPRPDDSTVVFYLNTPYAVLAASFCSTMFCIVDADSVEAYGDAFGTDPASANGTGKYRCVNWEKDQGVTLEAVEGHWSGSDALTKYIVTRPTVDSSSRLIALETGELDAIKDVASDDIEYIQTNPNLQLLRVMSNGIFYFNFNMNDSMMADTNIRKAIVACFDGKTLCETLLAEVGYRPVSCLSPKVNYIVDLGYKEQDLEAAKEYLALAGYPDGFETTIVTTTRYAYGVEMAEYLASQLELIGIKADIEVIEWSVYSDAIYNWDRSRFDWPIFLMGNAPSSMDADGGMNPLFATVAPDATYRRNYGYYENEEVDALLKEGYSTADPAQRQEIYTRLQEILYTEDPAAVYLYVGAKTVASSTKVSGIVMLSNGYVDFENAVVLK